MMLLRSGHPARVSWRLLIFSGTLVGGYQVSKAQLQPGEHSAGATKHCRGIVAVLQLSNQLCLPDKHRSNSAGMVRR